MSGILARARWTSSKGHSGLYAREKDGGALLAMVFWTVRFGYVVGLFKWEAGAASGEADTLHSAQRAARKALRGAGEQ